MGKNVQDFDLPNQTIVFFGQYLRPQCVFFSNRFLHWDHEIKTVVLSAINCMKSENPRMNRIFSKKKTKHGMDLKKSRNRAEGRGALKENLAIMIFCCELSQAGFKGMFSRFFYLLFLFINLINSKIC